MLCRSLWRRMNHDEGIRWKDRLLFKSRTGQNIEDNLLRTIIYLRRNVDGSHGPLFAQYDPCPCFWLSVCLPPCPSICLSACLSSSSFVCLYFPLVDIYVSRSVVVVVVSVSRVCCVSRLSISLRNFFISLAVCLSFLFASLFLFAFHFLCLSICKAFFCPSSSGDPFVFLYLSIYLRKIYLVYTSLAFAWMYFFRYYACVCELVSVLYVFPSSWLLVELLPLSISWPSTHLPACLCICVCGCMCESVCHERF